MRNTCQQQLYCNWTLPFEQKRSCSVGRISVDDFPYLADLVTRSANDRANCSSSRRRRRRRSKQANDDSESLLPELLAADLRNIAGSARRHRPAARSRHKRHRCLEGDDERTRRRGRRLSATRGHVRRRRIIEARLSCRRRDRHL